MSKNKISEEELLIRESIIQLHKSYMILKELEFSYNARLTQLENDEIKAKEKK